MLAGGPGTAFVGPDVTGLDDPALLLAVTVTIRVLPTSPAPTVYVGLSAPTFAQVDGVLQLCHW